MPGFFEMMASRGQSGPRLAAWVIEGPAAGAKALFARGAEGNAPVWIDETFPEDLGGTIAALPPDRCGLLDCPGGRAFLEPVAGERRLVVCGAGHVALCLIRLGAMLGFRVTAIEDRESYAARAREAGAGQVICRPFGEALDVIDGDDMTAFVIMTRGHEHDVDCLRRVLRKPFAYAGVMGSRGRAEQIRRQMLEEGVDPIQMARVRMPVGLAIGARTPEEIAVAVAAELVSTMNALDAGEPLPPGMAEALAALEGSGTLPEGTGTVPAVLALIVDKTGEAPRRPGTKMLVRADGSFLGTVGGGWAEAEILRLSGAMLREGCRECRLVRISMKKGALRCGGEIAVLLLPLGPDG